MKKIFLPLIILSASFFSVDAQDIVYADVNKSDVQRMNFEILGKVANNYLVYKEVKGKNRISVYDESMRLLEEVPINHLPDRRDLLDLSFFPGTSTSNLVYQYQAENIVYVMASKIEANGKILDEPVVLDTTMISYRAESKIYNTLSSEDGSKIMIFKIKRNADRTQYTFSTRLYDSEMMLINEDQFTVPMEEAGHRLGSYNLTNEGKLALVRYNRMVSGNISGAELIEKAPGSDYKTYDLGTSIGMGELFLDDVKLKVDEKAQRYIMASLYSNTKKGNIDGIYVSGISKSNGQREFEKTAVFDEDFRKRAKSGTALKSVFNDFFINNIVMHDDGGFTVSSEALYTSGGNAWNRWGYWGGPWGGPWGGFYGGWGWSPYRFYSPFFYRSYWWGGPWGGPWGGAWGGYGGWSRYHADNVAIVSFDADGNKAWDNVIVKRQDDTETDGSISYQILNDGDNMHFLLNNEGKISSLEDIVVNQTGIMQESNPIDAKDKNIDFMPRYGKQVGPGQLILPYRYKNNISFAKVTI